MDVTLIVAADSRGGIARDGAIPWRSSRDLKRFKELTTGTGCSAVLMGHTTWRSLPERFRPLPDRLNLVLSHHALSLAGATVVGSVDEALIQAAGAEALWVMGGAQVYAAALAHSLTSAIELTQIEGDFGCNLRWPGVPEDFRLVSAQSFVERGLRGVFERWERA